MSEEMMEIICRTGLGEAIAESFEREKITPDIVQHLSLFDMEQLGVKNRSDIMKLRIDCLKYGGDKPVRNCTTHIGGAPMYNLPKELLVNLIDIGFRVCDIAKLLTMSERTIFRRMSYFGLKKVNYSEISDADLDIELNSLLNEYPLSGENMLKQMLAQKGIKIQRERLRDCIHRIDKLGVEQRRRRRLHRRTYSVQRPNSLWHIDTNHKLVRWRFIVVGGIDGFSRMIMFLQCTDNNTSNTVFQCFLSAVERYGIPDRVRTDKGLENISIAEFMLQKKGQNGIITGASTHNQRIERLWRDVFEGVLCFFYNLFYFMEDQGILDPLNDVHLFALNFVYLEEINKKLSFWNEAWSNHRMRTTRSTPRALWMSEQILGASGVDPVIFEEELQNHEDAAVRLPQAEGNRPIFETIQPNFSEECMQMLNDIVPNHSDNFGISSYSRCLQIIERYYLQIQ